MGILNATPDSFFDGGEYNNVENALQRAHQIVNDGGKIIDIGGYSSRPGSTHISEEEELKRVIPIITEIKKELPESIISIDTFRKNVAEKALKSGAAIINDISAGNLDEKMLHFVAETKVPYIMMHMIGTPQNMQQHTQYNNLIGEMMTYFSEKINYLKSKNVNDIIIDPGFGFSKTLDQNYDLLKNLNTFSILEQPLLVGLSRKSMIWKHLNTDKNDALAGTVALNMYALTKGAKILRVHDVKEACQTVELYKKLS